LSPLGSGYLFVVALLVGVAVLRTRRAAVAALAVMTAAGLLWTFSRSSLLALALGLAVLAALRRRPWELGAAVLVVAVAFGWAHLFPKIGPTGNWTKADLVYQHEQARGTKQGFTATSSS